MKRIVVSIAAIALLYEFSSRLLLEPPAEPVESELFNVPAEGACARGPAHAKLTIVEFADATSPYSARASEVITRVLEAHEGDVRVVSHPCVGLGADDLRRESALAEQFDARGHAPTFFINGRRLRGAQSFEVFEATIQEELTRAEGMLERCGSLGVEDLYAALTRGGLERAPAPHWRELTMEAR